MGSVGFAAWIAKLAFIALLAWGYATGEPRRRTLAMCAIVGAAIWILLPQTRTGSLLVTPALAIVDIALVCLVFKRDVRIG